MAWVKPWFQEHVYCVVVY